MLSMRVNGLNFVNFQNLSVVRSIDTLVGGFTATATATPDNLFPIVVGDRVEVLADNTLVLTGYTEQLSVRHSVDTHLITISGRGLLCDLIDSTVGTNKEFTGVQSLNNITRKVLDDINLSTIKIVNNAGTIKDFEDAEITSADVGQPCYDFLQSFAWKRQVFLTSDSKGNLVFDRGANTKSGLTLLHKVGGNQNTIISAELNIDNSLRFNKYTVRSQLNPTFQELGITPSDISDQVASVTDSKIRSSRLLEFSAEESSDTETALERATWESNIRRSQAFNYSCVVQGHTVNNTPWEPNKLVNIVDDFCNVNGEFFLKTVDMQYDLDRGSITVLTFTTKDAYQLEAEQSQRDANSNDNADDLQLF